MGFLNNLKKKGEELGKSLDSFVETTVKPAAAELSNGISAEINQASEFITENAKTLKENRGSLSEAIGNLAKAAEEYKQAAEDLEKSVNASVNADESDTRSAEEKIAAALAEEFPQYEVKKYVSPATLGGTGRFLDYSFGIYDGGAPKLFIMLVGKTTCSTRMYRWSKEEAEKAGVTLINFIEHYPNKPEYVKERLHQYI